MKTGAHPAVVTFGDGSYVELKPYSTFELSKIPNSPFVNFFQNRGSARWKIRKGARHRVHGANITVAVRGTTFSVETTRRQDRLRVYEGSVMAGYRMLNPSFRVRAGFELIVRGDRFIGPRRFKRGQGR